MPDDEGRVEPVFERGHRMVDQPAAASDVKPHVVALGGHSVDVLCSNSDKAAEVGGPEFVDPFRRLAGLGRGDPVMFDIVAGPVERSLESLGVHRLHQIIDRRDFERGDRELVEVGHEHDGGAWLLAGERSGNVDPVEARHGDV
jgi:hypothetical protein